MTDFTSLLNWKLLKGSHKFPGPDGGTCINEAAIIAAGFEYRAVKSHRDFPPCFSIVVGSYALSLNDYMPDEIRNRLLLPFVTKLSGTADTWEVEMKRLRLIISRTKAEIDYSATATATAAATAAAYAAAYAADAAYADAAAAAACAAYAAAATVADAAADVWKTTISILSEAISIGKHSDEYDQALVIQRMNAARQLVKA